MTDRSIIVRRADVTDADAIATVHVASWRTTYPGIVDQSYIDGLSVADRAVNWRQRLGDSSDAAPDVLVAESLANGIVGLACGGQIRAAMPEFDAELYAIYLLAEFQGVGLGRRLIREWARLSVARGLHAGIVRVLAANPACKFYERLGAHPFKDASLSIGGREYPEVWYGWPSLGDLAA